VVLGGTVARVPGRGQRYWSVLYKSMKTRELRLSACILYESHSARDRMVHPARAGKVVEVAFFRGLAGFWGAGRALAIAI
jgi:hypothetical protein